MISVQRNLTFSNLWSNRHFNRFSTGMKSQDRTYLSVCRSYLNFIRVVTNRATAFIRMKCEIESNGTATRIKITSVIFPWSVEGLEVIRGHASVFLIHRCFLFSRSTSGMNFVRPETELPAETPTVVQPARRILSKLSFPTRCSIINRFFRFIIIRAYFHFDTKRKQFESIDLFCSNPNF